MKLFKKVISLLLFFSSVPLLGHFYKIEKFVHDNGNSITCLSDYHVSNKTKNKINNKQRDTILEIAKGLNAFMIVEDEQAPSQSICKNAPTKKPQDTGMMATIAKLFMAAEDEPILPRILTPVQVLEMDPLQFEPNDYILNPEYCLKELVPNKERTPLYGISSACHYFKLPYKNIDFRTIATLSRVKRFNITMRDGFACSEKIKNEVSEYSDHIILNEYYKDSIRTYDWILQGACSFFDYLQVSDKPFEQIKIEEFEQKGFVNGRHKQLADRMLAMNEAKNYDDQKEIENLFERNQKTAETAKQYLNYLFSLYNHKFINARILHTAYEYSSKDNVFICAGGGHIRQVGPLLERIGWKKVLEIGSDSENEEPDAIDPSTIKAKLLAKE